MMALRCAVVSANEASALFDVVGEGAPVGLAFVDTGLRYVRINAALAQINGRSIEYHLGRRVDDALPEFAADLLPIYRQVLDTGRPVLERELTGERPDGRVRHVVASWFPIRQAGTIAGVGVVVVDVTARKTAEMRLEGVLRQLPVGVVIADADGRVMLTNGRLEEMGLSTSPSGAQLAEQQASFWRPDGTLYANDEWPLTRALQGGEVVRAEEMEFARADGSRGVLEASAAPIRDAGGGVVAAVVVVQDVTERKRAAQRQELLVRAGEVLDSALGVDDRLDRLARVLVPRLADFVKIELLEGRTGRRPVAIAHEDPEREALMRRLRDRVTLGEEERVGMAATFATGESKLTREIVPAAVARSAGERAGAAAAELMEAIGPRSQIVVPLRARGRVLGALSLTMAESGRHYVEEDLELARDLGLRAGLAVDNARLYEDEQRRAEQLDALAGASLAIHAKRSVGERLQLIADRARSMVAAERALVGMTIGRSEPVLATAPAGAADPLPDGALVAPMIARDGSPLGTIGVAGKPTGFTLSDRILLEDLARISALAIENARLEELERHIARTLQGSLLPSSLPEIPGIDAAARYLAGGEGTVVGGDLYDLYAVDDEWALVLGDVCGKGAEAAALTGMVRYTIRAEAVHHSSPAEVLRLLNEAILRQNDDGRFCTVLHGRLHVGDGYGVRLVIAGAGHPPPLLLRANGAVEAIECNGPLLGIVDDVRAPDVTVELAPGDVLVCFTDGVTEGRGPGGLYGDERLAELLGASQGAGAGAIADRITQAVLDFQGGRTQDDLALLVLRVRDDAA